MPAEKGKSVGEGSLSGDWWDTHIYHHPEKKQLMFQFVYWHYISNSPQLFFRAKYLVRIPVTSENSRIYLFINVNNDWKE